MHIVRTVGGDNYPAVPNIPSSGPDNNGSRPGTSGTTSSEFDSSFGQRRRMAEDPNTHIEDDRQPSQQQQIFEYYTEDDLNRQLSGTTASASGARGSGGSEERMQAQADMERGKSFGRRRRPAQIGDLEKGQMTR